MLRFSLFLSIFILEAQAIKVLIAKEAIRYEEKLSTSKLRVVDVTKIKKACNPLSLQDIQNNEYITSKYINRNSILCKRDVKVYENQTVLFNFGNLQIEQKGKIIFENENFIRIKKADGKIEKIYKNGNNR